MKALACAAARLPFTFDCRALRELISSCKGDTVSLSLHLEFNGELALTAETGEHFS